MHEEEPEYDACLEVPEVWQRIMGPREGARNNELTPVVKPHLLYGVNVANDIVNICILSILDLCLFDSVSSFRLSKTLHYATISGYS